MFDIGWTELMVIGVVALIVVGPKDLPGMFRTLGRFTGKIKGMAREFSQAMNDAADEAGVKDVASTLKSATNPGKMGLDKLNEAATKFEAWDPSKSKPKTERGPARISAISSAMRIASSGSCVTNNTAAPSSFNISSVSSRMPSRKRLSSPENGSSISITLGFGASARASATRCCSPSDSSCG